MKLKYFIFFLIPFFSCETATPTFNQIKESIANTVDNINLAGYNNEKDSNNWNIENLDTAENIPYLNFEERNVILELNKVRSEPAKYATLYIEPRISKFTGLLYGYGDVRLKTNEGKKAVIECVNALKKTRSMQVLSPNKELFELARKQVEQQGPTGQTGHSAPTGLSFEGRVKQANLSFNFIGENIDYGNSHAREIVIALLIDDGVPSRGHRKNIMTSQFSIVGLKIGNHKKYTNMCVIDFGRN